MTQNADDQPKNVNITINCPIFCEKSVHQESGRDKKISFDRYFHLAEMDYPDLQLRLGEAMKKRVEQHERAIEIMQSLGRACASILHFPQENVQFKNTSDTDRRTGRSSSPRTAIKRDEKGTWRADIVLSVDSIQPSGCRVDEYVTVEVKFGDGGDALVRLHQADASIELPSDGDFSNAVVPLVEKLAEKIVETCDWVETGVGPETGRVVGFNVKVGE